MISNTLIASINHPEHHNNTLETTLKTYLIPKQPHCYCTR